MVSDNLLYDRYLGNAYRYAKVLNVSGWNITQAAVDFQNQYSLWNPSADRYYDEDAETLSMDLQFALNGLDTSTAVVQVWNQTQGTWNGNYYVYKQAQPEYECEAGNFAMIVAEYRSYFPNIPYFDRVTADLEYKLLASGYDSPAWGSIGVIQHASDNPQLRLEETFGDLIALQMLYPEFSASNQDSFQRMLSNGQMWKGLTSSSLYDPESYSFRVTNDSEITFSDDMSMLGAMDLFLSGIIPGTGCLAISAINEAYQDYRTCFPISEWQFNYQNASIRIPVNAGSISFIFGDQRVTQSFPSNGIYAIQFSKDWNTIISAQKVGEIPVVPSLNVAPLPTIQPTSNPMPFSTVPNSLIASPTSTDFPTPTLIDANPQHRKTSINTDIALALTITFTMVAISAVTIYFKKKNRIIK